MWQGAVCATSKADSGECNSALVWRSSALPPHSPEPPCPLPTQPPHQPIIKRAISTSSFSTTNAGSTNRHSLNNQASAQVLSDVWGNDTLQSALWGCVEAVQRRETNKPPQVKQQAVFRATAAAQSLGCVRLFGTPRTTACQTSLCITTSRSSLKLTFIESVMPSNHLTCRPHLLPHSIFTSIRVFSN